MDLGYLEYVKKRGIFWAAARLKLGLIGFDWVCFCAVARLKLGLIGFVLG